MSKLNLKVVSGSATADEIAAIMAVVTALSNQQPSAAVQRSNWSNPTLLHRRPLPANWTTSYLPR